MATVSTLPPISQKNSALNTAKSAPASPRPRKMGYRQSTSIQNSQFSTQNFSTKRKTTTFRNSHRLPPAARTTLALNPDFNEFTDPTELSIQKKEILYQIANARNELIPFKEEVRRLEYQYSPAAYDPTFRVMKDSIQELEQEKNALDEQYSAVLRACQDSVFYSNQVQNDKLKQDYQEQKVLLDRIEKQLDSKKEKLQKRLDNDRVQRIEELKQQAKELNKQLKELKEEGNSLYVNMLKKLSTAGACQTASDEKLQPYKRKLYNEQYTRDKKKSELHTMKIQHDKKVNELKQLIEMRNYHKKRIQERDNWKQRLNIEEENLNEQNEEDEAESPNTEKNGILADSVNNCTNALLGSFPDEGNPKGATQPIPKIKMSDDDDVPADDEESK